MTTSEGDSGKLRTSHHLPIVSLETLEALASRYKDPDDPYSGNATPWGEHVLEVYERTRLANPNLIQFLEEYFPSSLALEERTLLLGFAAHVLTILDHQAQAINIDPRFGIPKGPDAYALPVISDETLHRILTMKIAGESEGTSSAWWKKLEEVRQRLFDENLILVRFVATRLQLMDTRQQGMSTVIMCAMFALLEEQADLDANQSFAT